MSEDGGIEVRFTPIPITGIVGCVIPVVPGTDGSTDGEPVHRSELCAVDANWLVGSAPTCDVHLRQICETIDAQDPEEPMDWPGLLREAGRDRLEAEIPWAERRRHSQKATRDALARAERA